MHLKMPVHAALSPGIGTHPLDAHYVSEDRAVLRAFAIAVIHDSAPTIHAACPVLAQIIERPGVPVADACTFLAIGFSFQSFNQPHLTVSMLQGVHDPCMHRSKLTSQIGSHYALGHMPH